MAISELKCPNCAAPFKPGESTCQYCGHSFIVETPAVQPPQEEEEMEEEAPIESVRHSEILSQSVAPAEPSHSAGVEWATAIMVIVGMALLWGVWGFVAAVFLCSLVTYLVKYR